MTHLPFATAKQVSKMRIWKDAFPVSLKSSVVILISAIPPTGLTILLRALQEGVQFQELLSYHYRFHSIDVGIYVGSANSYIHLFSLYILGLEK